MAAKLESPPFHIKDFSIEWKQWLQYFWQRVNNIVNYSETLTPASVAANTTAEQTFTITGLTTNDVVIVNKPSLDAGLGIVNVRVSTADTLAITYCNVTAGGLTPTSETYEIIAIRKL
jgi:hypothetical protein